MRPLIILAMLCSTVEAQQLVAIDWNNRDGATVVSSSDNPTRLSDAQLLAQGYQKATYTDGSVYWFKQVMTCGNSQTTLHSGSS